MCLSREEVSNLWHTISSDLIESYHLFFDERVYVGCEQSLLCVSNFVFRFVCVCLVWNQKRSRSSRVDCSSAHWNNGVSIYSLVDNVTITQRGWSLCRIRPCISLTRSPCGPCVPITSSSSSRTIHLTSNVFKTSLPIYFVCRQAYVSFHSSDFGFVSPSLFPF